MKKVLLITAAILLTAVMPTDLMALGMHNGHGNRGKGSHKRPRKEVVYCASREQMLMVMQVLEKQSFDDNKLDIAELCVTLGSFCNDDLAQIAKVFSFDDNRLEFLKFAYAYCPDRENYPSLRDCFQFSTSYDNLMDYLYPKRNR